VESEAFYSHFGIFTLIRALDEIAHFQGKPLFATTSFGIPGEKYHPVGVCHWGKRVVNNIRERGSMETNVFVTSREVFRDKEGATSSIGCEGDKESVGGCGIVIYIIREDKNSREGKG
jgi:hypothetical protein